MYTCTKIRIENLINPSFWFSNWQQFDILDSCLSLYFFIMWYFKAESQGICVFTPTLQFTTEQLEFEQQGSTYMWIFFNKYTVSVNGYKAADSIADNRNGKGKMLYVVACTGIRPVTLVLLAPHCNQLS